MKKMMRVGIRVTCAMCGRTKAPHGRSISPETVAGYCTYEQCEGYLKEPYPGSLFPRETEEDFGFPVGDSGTEIREIEIKESEK
jgi:hypothetical protein